MIIDQVTVDTQTKDFLVLLVHVDTVNGSLHDLDQEVAGIYRIALPISLNQSTIAGAALDIFHSSVPIKLLEDFEFKVTDVQGGELKEPLGHRPPYPKEGFLIGKD